MAEGAGFEPAIRFPAYTLSRRAPSTTRPPLRIFAKKIGRTSLPAGSAGRPRRRGASRKSAHYSVPRGERNRAIAPCPALTQSPAPNLAPPGPARGPARHPGIARNLEPDAAQLRANAPNRLCRHAEKSTLSPCPVPAGLRLCRASGPPTSFGASPKFGPAYRFSTISVRKLRSKRCDGHHFGGPSPLYRLKSSSIRNRSGGASEIRIGGHADRSATQINGFAP